MSLNEEQTKQLFESYAASRDRVIQYYDDFKKQSDKDSIEFAGFVLQTGIFQFDINYEIAAFVALMGGHGFARKLAFRTLLMKIYEYKNQFESRILPDFKKLIESRGKEFPSTEINHEREKHLKQFKIIDSYKDIRNDAAGHYRKIEKQVLAIESMDEIELLHCVSAMMNYGAHVLVILMTKHPVI